MYSNSIFESFFAAQGYALFEYLGEGNFRLIGSWPAWCEDIWGAQPVGERIIRLGDKSTFLDNFFFDAGEFWNSRSQGSLDSGNWIERGNSAKETPLEASAYLLDGKQILIVRHLSETFARQQAWFQTARDSLLQHEKLIKEIQKKEILLHCIVHDLTQPLSAMNGVFHLLERESLPTALKKYVKAGERESQRQELMIRGILEVFSSDLATQQAKDGTATEVPDLLACAKQAIEECSTAFRERDIHLRLGPRTDASRDWHVVGDASRLDRIFGNLLENAKRYTPKASTVTIGLEDQSDFVLAFVDDEGPGLPQGQPVDQLFALFSKGKTHAGKAGLGLYFCKITVERWGGTIGAQTREQGGSRFWFRLPRVAKMPALETVAAPAEKSSRKEKSRERSRAEKPLHILVADDADLNRDLVVELLHKRGHSAEGVGDGRAALTALERHNFDIVLMDEEMPHMTGLQATSAIRQREASSGRHQIIIGLSGHASEEDEARFRSAGMDAYLAKPVHMDKLYEVIESAAQNRRKTDEAGAATQPRQPAQTAPNALHSWPAQPALTDTVADSEDVAAHLQRTTGGNEKLIRSLAKTFLADAPKTLALIRTAVTKKDAVKLARAAHLLKGSIAIFGASKAVAAARNLEAIGRAGNLAEAAGALQSLESEFALLQQELRTIQSPPDLKAKRKSKPRAQGRARSRPNR
jgi:signal transduction histidine kinase/CheY-like chemotaxis protein/HPt (histidine-containing phosphotransfer) domain-containing protein